MLDIVTFEQFENTAEEEERWAVLFANDEPLLNDATIAGRGALTWDT